MARYLFIVTRDQPDLYEYLTRVFSRNDEVEVRLDRRERIQAHGPEQRRASVPQAGSEDYLRPLGFGGLIWVKSG